MLLPTFVPVFHSANCVIWWPQVPVGLAMHVKMDQANLWNDVYFVAHFDKGIKKLCSVIISLFRVYLFSSIESYENGLIDDTFIDFVEGVWTTRKEGATGSKRITADFSMDLTGVDVCKQDEDELDTRRFRNIVGLFHVLIPLPLYSY